MSALFIEGPPTGRAKASGAVRLICGTVLAVLGFLVVCVMLAALRPAPAPTAPTAPTVAEDSPAWDCATMGNRVCGPGSVPLSTYCRAEPNIASPDGVEVIAYPAGVEVTGPGARVGCP